MAAARLLEGFLGAALLLAAIAKTADLEATGASLARLGLRPGLARAVVSVEAAVAAALLLGVVPAAATTAAVGLGVGFVVVQLRAGKGGGCGCLGSFDLGLPPRVAFARAGVFLAVAGAAFGLRLASGTFGFDWRATHPLLAVAGAALALATLVVARSLLHLRRPLPV